MINDLAVDEVDDVDIEDEDELEITSSDDNDSTDETTDNIGDPSVEINVQELINELEADGLTKDLRNGPDAKKRLEGLMERKRALRELEDFDDYDI